MRAATTLLAACVAASGLGLGAAAADNDSKSAPAFHVIVHAHNPSTALDRKFVADAFLKKTTRWAGDTVIRPVDQKPKSSVRRAFSRAVLKRSVAAVRSYWRRVVYSGRGVPPPELDGDKEIVDYVRKHRGAIGYVSSGAELTGVKVVQVK